MYILIVLTYPPPSWLYAPPPTLKGCLGNGVLRKRQESDTRFPLPSTPLLKTIHACYQRNSGPPEVVIASPVVHLLATELSNYRHTVRSTAKRAIELMAAAKGCSTTDILMPCRGAVEGHIFSKQLRAVQVCLFLLS